MIFRCVGFKGVQPTHTVAVIVADSQKRAKALLEKELAKVGLQQSIPTDQIVEITDGPEYVEILADGDY